MTLREANQALLLHLQQVYDLREAGNIANWVMEHLTGYDNIGRAINSDSLLSEAAAGKLKNYTQELVKHRPVQYVLGESWFCGMKFYVDEHVLIPRPETEELVQWVADDHPCVQARVLDIGTGSGCIPIALKKLSSAFKVYSCDISGSAIEVAKKNADILSAEVTFLQIDVLDRSSWETIPAIEIIVSNPPYISLKEKGSMGTNVVEYEPSLALFVEDADPLLFYKAIAALGKIKLADKGKIYVEIHENMGKATAAIFRAEGYRSAEIRKDMQGKERMIKIIK